MTDAATRHLLHEIFANTDRDARAEEKRDRARATTCTELRALIVVAYDDLKATLGDVRVLVDSRRPGVKIGGSGPKGATTPAPINVGALSVLEEAAEYLPDLHDRLTRQVHLAGGPAPTGPGLAALLELVTDPARLRPVHRDLERLADQAHRVVDGQRRLPDPCPHCRRKTLLVDHDTGVTTCAKDPKTGRLEPCRCADRYCSCTHDRRYRHTWSRAARAHLPTSWQGLSRAQKEALVLEATIDRVRALHARTPVQPWATDCGDHDHEQEHLPAWGEAICVTCPPTGHVCLHCLQLAGGDLLDLESPAAWPCPTVRALDDLRADPITTPTEPTP